MPHTQNVGLARCLGCNHETNSTFGKPHRKCPKRPKGLWKSVAQIEAEEAAEKAKSGKK
jgi:hypothetical protein